MNVLQWPGTGMSIAVLVSSSFALSLPSPVLGQAHASNVRLVGFKAGIATSNTRPAGVPELPAGESVTRLTAGVFGRLPLGRRIAAQAEVQYLQQGTDSGNIHIRTTVLRMPVTLQVLIPAGDVGLRIYAGGTFDLPLSCSMDELTFDSGFGPVSTVSGCPISQGGGAAGLTGGALVDLALGKTVLTLDARYYRGLSRLEARGFNILFGRFELPDLQGFRGFELTVALGFPTRARRRS